MAFTLSFSDEKFLANQDDSRDVELLRTCSEGREPFEFSTPKVRLVLDRVPHDCRLIRTQISGQKEILSVCFGWCGLVDGQRADFDDKTLAYVHAFRFSIGLVVRNVRYSAPPMPSAIRVSVSSSPSRRLAAAPG